MLIDSASKLGEKLPINSYNSIQTDTFHTVFEFSPVFFSFYFKGRRGKKKENAKYSHGRNYLII